MLIEQKYGGVTRYYYELIKQLEQRQDIKVDIHCAFNINSYFAEYFGKKEVDIPHISRISKPINKYMSIHKWGQGGDIIHPTFYDPYILKRKDAPIVITVYDMIHELLPDCTGNNIKMIEKKCKMIHAADHIIAISQSTKDDLLRIYPEIDDEKVTVIHIGCNMNEIEVDREFDQEVKMFKYVLYVGSRVGYKNFDNFIESIRPLLKKNRELQLFCAGGGGFTEYEKRLIGDLEGQVKQISVNDKRLKSLYKYARCFVFPSLYEGFGIPTLEAFVNECPAIISNSSSMPEVGGDAALYINPNDILDIREKIEMVIDDDKIRKDMIKKGKEQLEKFSWQKISDQTLKCYRNVLER